MKKTTVLLITSFILIFYLFSRLYVTDAAIDIMYQEECPENVTKNRICSVELVEKRPDFLMLKIHYHYVKDKEDSNRIVIKANRGSHDNTVGTKRVHSLKEGSNNILIPFGLYKSTDHKESNPYISEYIVIRAKGLSKDNKYYITPHLLETYIKYKKSWYAEGDKTSW